MVVYPFWGRVQELGGAASIHADTSRRPPPKKKKYIHPSTFKPFQTYQTKIQSQKNPEFSPTSLILPEICCLLLKKNLAVTTTHPTFKPLQDQAQGRFLGAIKLYTLGGPDGCWWRSWWFQPIQFDYTP